MSLLMIDVAYLATKSLVNVSCYLAKNTYNGIAYLTGYEMLKEQEVISEIDLIKEIKSLRGEIDTLRKEIRYINEDTFLLVDPNTTDEPNTTKQLNKENANEVDDKIEKSNNLDKSTRDVSYQLDMSNENKKYKEITL